MCMNRNTGLSFFNFQGVYTPDWKQVIFPILKPGRNPCLPTSYSPIAPSSVLGKTFQKNLNKILFWYLECNYILSPFQYSFRKGHNTLQVLADLNFHIEEAFRSNSKLYTIFSSTSGRPSRAFGDTTYAPNSRRLPLKATCLTFSKASSKEDP